MSLDYYNNFLSNIAQSPKEYYDELNQETINALWEDTDRLDLNVKEQIGLPFVDEYETYEAWVGTVADVSVAVNKNVSDFVTIWFKDCKHKINHKGQYYKLALDGVHEETYICYDKMNILSQASNFKVVRCNNVLTWINKQTGKVETLPCYLGNDISSTNAQYTKDGVIPNVRKVIYIQANDYTKSIEINDRFMFQHKRVFKVEEIDDYEQSQFSDGEVTFIKLYIAWSPLLPQDNTELNVCDYYQNQYTLKINQTSPLTVKPNDKIQLTATVYDSANRVCPKTSVIWSTSNETVAEVDLLGNVTIVTSEASTCDIRCAIEGNEDVSDTITINVELEQEDDKVLIVSPTNKITLYTDDTQVYTVDVYNNGIKTDDVISCIPSFIDNTIYTLESNGNSWQVNYIGTKKKDLTLTFSSENISPVDVQIRLGGMF